MTILAEGGIQIDTATGIGIVVFLGGVIGGLFKMLLASKDAQHDKLVKELEAVQKSYREIAAEAVKSATDTANFHRMQEGKPPIIPLLPTIPESQSPPTASQQATADIATLRATMAQLKLEIGQKARQPQTGELR